MLQFIPALILLLLHGPAGLDELSREGRLPASLQALVRDLRQREPAPAVAVLEIRRLEEALPVVAVAPAEELSTEVPVVPTASVPAGFLSAQRSRDGPSA